jgi:hypothetical protein
VNITVSRAPKPLKLSPVSSDYHGEEAFVFHYSEQRTDRAEICSITHGVYRDGSGLVRW